MCRNGTLGAIFARMVHGCVTLGKGAQISQLSDALAKIRARETAPDGE